MLTFLSIALGYLVGSVTATNILLTNDDGWAVAQIRAQFSAINSAGYNVVLSAPAENESGTGSSSAPPTTLTIPCEFDTCPVGSPPEGFNASDTRLNYVNSFPVDSVRYGIQTLSPQFFGGNPDFVVSGPNVGNNLGTGVSGSGTVGAACEAAIEGLPSAAFSGASTSQVSYTTLQSSPTSTATLAALLYSQLTTQFLSAILASPARPILPTGITLNVNYPSFSLSGCTNINNYNWVFTRLVANSSAVDVTTCGSNHLPDESTVVRSAGCHATVTVIGATTKRDVDASTQGVVLNRFGSSFFSCV